MIPVFLRDLAPRLLWIALIAWAFYLLEPGFHQHEAFAPGTAPELDATGLSYTLANLGGLTLLILLAGFIATDRRRGYYRLFFSHPTSPLVFYGVRWALALGVALGVVVLFWVFGQLAAWGELRVGAAFLLHALLFMVVYGGLMAFVSALLPRGDALLVGAVYLATEIWLWLVVRLGADPFTPAVRRLIAFVLPPHLALTDVYSALAANHVAWGAVVFALGYGVFWIGLAGLLLRTREWP